MFRPENNEYSASFRTFERLGFNLENPIEFDSIKIEEEIILCDLKSTATSFIGEDEESTEIDSMIAPLNFTLSTIKDDTEKEEILAILKNKPNSCKNQIFSRTLFKSLPEFSSKKVSLNGRVLLNDLKQGFTKSLTPHKSKCVPARPSNPFFKNIDSWDNISN